MAFDDVGPAPSGSPKLAVVVVLVVIGLLIYFGLHGRGPLDIDSEDVIASAPGPWVLDTSVGVLTLESVSRMADGTLLLEADLAATAETRTLSLTVTNEFGSTFDFQGPGFGGLAAGDTATRTLRLQRSPGPVEYQSLTVGSKAFGPGEVVNGIAVPQWQVASVTIELPACSPAWRC